MTGLLNMDKTFDTVDHGTLLSKLRKYGVVAIELIRMVHVVFDGSQANFAPSVERIPHLK